MLASPARTLDVSIMPQPGQVWVMSPLPGYLHAVQAPIPSLQGSKAGMHVALGSRDALHKLFFHAMRRDQLKRWG